MGREKNIRLIATIIAALAAVPLFMPRYAAAESARGLDHPELITAKNTPIEGVLPARNGESDEVCFEITTEPVKGSVELLGEGRFVYSPRENKKGRDYFGYRTVDVAGNRSEEGTVLIRINKK